MQIFYFLVVPFIYSVHILGCALPSGANVYRYWVSAASEASTLT